ncbi:MAG: DNA polymerase III subunit alpha [Deltaproteobacteria bacterium]|nr:DNA polymerase III subunit alpha [Deltaproteobacteria bacterium]
MNNPPFVHLHVHTHYSLLDGAIRPDDLFMRALEYDMPAVTMTDHGNMFGAISFYKKAKAKGIKPVIGCEMYVTQGDCREKEAGASKSSYHHLVLLIQDYEGYQNLCKLLTTAYFEGFYYKPRIDKDLLRRHNKGLIATSACLQGEVAVYLAAGDVARAEQAALEYADIFDAQRFYLELQDSGIPEQKKVNQGLIEIGRKLDLPLVATNDCHYLRREEARAHDILLCIQTGKTVEDDNRMRFTTDELYFKSPAEMWATFGHVPEALENTIRIADQCNLQIPLGTPHFPVFQTESGRDVEVEFEEGCRRGLESILEELKTRRPGFGPEAERAYRERLDREIDVIRQMGFAGYFLIVADFVHHGRENQCPVGPGRGSAAGSLAAYALGITDIDPLPYQLLFERFLNLERQALPDIDVDFCMENRDRVLDYVARKYGGRDRVAQIITFGSIKARAVIRDVGRALNMPFNDVDRIAKLIPNKLNITLEEAIKEEPRLKELEQKDPKVKELLAISRSLEGLPRHASTHAAGVVISDRPLDEYMPLYRGANGEVVTQYDMKSVEDVGLIKFDFLGLKTLTVIEHALNLIQKKTGSELNLNRIPLDDAKAYELLCAGDTTGVFQLESAGMKELLKRMKPACFEDVIALVALYRPGPMESGMIDDYVRRKHGETKVTYLLPELEPILKDTYGVIVYQEQVMQIASALADYSLGDADILRRAMGKKKPEVMAKERVRFMAGAAQKRIDRDKAAKVFDLMEKFAGYGFNKSHSAAYGLIAYQTAFLKAHHPVEFMTALLTCDMNNTDNVVKFISECREHGIPVLPPDVNESRKEFTVVGDRIRFGLAAVKNVGSGAIDSIIECREEKGSYKSIFDFCERVDLRRVNRRVIESLIKAGAFDSFGARRSQLMAAMDDAMERAQSIHRDRAEGQMNLFTFLQEEAGQERMDPELPAVEEWSERRKLTFEKEALGFYITGHPLDRFREEIRLFGTTDSARLKERIENDQVRMAGVCASVKTINTKKGDRMAFVTLEDEQGAVELVVFSDVYQNCIEVLEKDDPVLVSGKVSKDDKGEKIICADILPLSEVRERFTSQVDIELDGDKLTTEQLWALKDIMDAHRGGCKTYIRLKTPHDGELVFALPQQLWIAPDRELVREVNGFLGYNAVRARA